MEAKRIRYGTLEPQEFSMFDTTGAQLKTDVVLVAGQAQISKDRGAFVNLNTLPTVQANGRWLWTPKPDKTETQAKKITIRINSPSYLHLEMEFETTAHPLAEWPDEGITPEHNSNLTGVTSAQATLSTPWPSVTYGTVLVELFNASDVRVGWAVGEMNTAVNATVVSWSSDLTAPGTTATKGYFWVIPKNSTINEMLADVLAIPNALLSRFSLAQFFHLLLVTAAVGGKRVGATTIPGEEQVVVRNFGDTADALTAVTDEAGNISSITINDVAL
jgi:hypothetical protein